MIQVLARGAVIVVQNWRHMKRIIQLSVLTFGAMFIFSGCGGGDEGGDGGGEGGTKGGSDSGGDGGSREGGGELPGRIPQSAQSVPYSHRSAAEPVGRRRIAGTKKIVPVGSCTASLDQT